MFITIINDCRDSNTMGRQSTRLATLFPGIQINTVGVENYQELEAAGNLIDILDAANGEEGVILLNSAPRHKKKWENGTPFGYFRYGKTLIVTTVDGFALSLVKKFGFTKEIYLTDIPTVATAMCEAGHIDTDLRDQIIRTQFRSFNYMPRLARWIMDGISVPHTVYSIDEVDDAPKAIWLIDNFGNAKTTVTPEEINFEAGKEIETKIGKFVCFDQMKDVEIGTPALTVGSSGIKDKRFVELIVMGGRAVDTFNLKVGQEIF